MKIAFIITGNNKTSIYIVTKDVINYLRENGHQVDVFFTERSDIPLDRYQKVIDRKKIFQSYFINRLFGFLKNILSRHIYEFITSRLVTNKFVFYFKGYDCIFLHGATAIAFRKLNLPHFLVLHSCKYDNFLGHRSVLTKKIHQEIYKKVYSAKHLLTVSNSVRLDMVNKMKAKPISIETIYNGFNFDEIIERARQGKTENVPQNFIMAAGRPDRTKRFDILLKAYAKSSKILPLVIFGEGRKLNELKKLSVKLGIENKVIFWGFCNNLLPYFKQASAYILSSDVEGLPTVVIESLAVGTPVVATDTGGIRELLGERLKEWIVPCRDVDALARKIDQVLQSPPLVGPEDLNFLDYRVVGKKYEKLSEKMKNGLL